LLQHEVKNENYLDNFNRNPDERRRRHWTEAGDSDLRPVLELTGHEELPENAQKEIYKITRVGPTISALLFVYMGIQAIEMCFLAIGSRVTIRKYCAIEIYSAMSQTR
jgi:hypothetical protein